ncbi:MAG TPA: DsbA family protein [Chthoniobacterales bacterium]|nr:DsbA family protein [Chthoniobacterales bacterium]
MRLTVTNYLEVISSWCFWAAPMWAQLQERYAGRVEFRWKIALMDAAGFPKTREQAEWYYRRSGLMMRSPFMLKPGWFQPDLQECLAPNLIAEAARDFGVHDDRVWLALANATVRDGVQTGEWETAAEIGAKAAGADKTKLLEYARWPEIEARVRASTKEFHDMQVTQRPTFVIDSDIGDRAVFSGFAKIEPLIATIEAMLDDIAFYESYAAHFGSPPPA